MIIPLDSLLTYSNNRYILTKAMMKTVDKVANIRDYPESNTNWKVVPNIIKLMLNDKIKFVYDAEAGEKSDSEVQ